MRKVLIIDTSVLCVYLGIPKMESCGKNSNYWDRDKIRRKLEEEEDNQTVFILPLAAVIETGNHITQIKSENHESSPYNMAMELTKIMVQAADEASPWVAFGEQSSLWEGDGLKKLASEWQLVVSQRISLGDTTIKILADYYCDEKGFQVEIMTGDDQLKSYERTPKITRRRRSG